jgi:hypothetical protein
LRTIEENIGFNHRVALRHVIGDRECAAAEGLAVNVVRPNHRIKVIARGRGRTRVHDRAQLHALHLLVPHAEGGKGRGVPGSVAVGKRSGSGAETELQNDVASVRPRLAVENVAGRVLKEREREKSGDDREAQPREKPVWLLGRAGAVHNSHKAESVRKNADGDPFTGNCKTIRPKYLRAPRFNETAKLVRQVDDPAPGREPD